MKIVINSLCIFCLSLSWAYAESLEDKANRKLLSRNFKDAIRQYSELAEKADAEQKGEYLKQLAKAYYHDQEQVKAFETFLEALKVTPKKMGPMPLPLKDEKHLYDEALRIYLDPRERDPDAVSIKLRDSYAGVWRLHSNYYYLGYLIAVSYANLSDFDEFFDAFYTSFKNLPEHYLAFKTQAILHIKLFERARTPEEKDEERKKILDALEQAKMRFPEDPSLYRMQIAFAPETLRKQVLERNLNEMLNGSMIVPRSDLSFYFDQLLAYGKIDLAKAFLAKSREWYHYSRTLDAAEEIIKEKQK